jgi:hypothetical protein
VEHERQALGRRQLVEHDLQSQPDPVCDQRLLLRIVLGKQRDDRFF